MIKQFILKIRLINPIILGLLMLACGSEKPKYIYKLYFGMSYQKGNISEEEFTCFLDTAITRKFPEGLTIYSVYGQWKQNDTITKEKTKVVEIAVKNTKTVRIKINEIRESYKKVFKQESVMFLVQKGKIDF